MNLNKAHELFQKVNWRDYQIPQEVLDQVDSVGGQSARDLRDKENWGYYSFLGSFCKQYQPKQIVELGGAWGTSAMVMAQETEGKVYSITLDEPPAFCYIKKDYPNLVKVIGDDLTLDSWPKELDFHKTDVWFIDSLHTFEQLKAELDLYTQFFKESTILFFDDIHMDELWPIWLELPYDKYDASELHVPSGWGIAVV